MKGDGRLCIKRYFQFTQRLVSGKVTIDAWQSHLLLRIGKRYSNQLFGKVQRLLGDLCFGHGLLSRLRRRSPRQHCSDSSRWEGSKEGTAGYLVIAVEWGGGSFFAPKLLRRGARPRGRARPRGVFLRFILPAPSLFLPPRTPPLQRS